MLLLEAQNLGVELEGFVLIVNEDAGEFDLHGLSSSALCMRICVVFAICCGTAGGV
jgi:hypothetical protein